MRVLVCGGRNYDNYDRVRFVLTSLPITTLIHGGARGADKLGGRYASENNIRVKEFPANWELYGKSAGSIRNSEMLEYGKPDLVVAFPGGKGTSHMIKIAKKAGVDVLNITATEVEERNRKTKFPVPDLTEPLLELLKIAREYSESHLPSGVPTKTHPRASLLDCGAL